MGYHQIKLGYEEKEAKLWLSEACSIDATLGPCKGYMYFPMNAQQRHNYTSNHMPHCTTPLVRCTWSCSTLSYVFFAPVDFSNDTENNDFGQLCLRLTV
jgi:hypothetical protein